MNIDAVEQSNQRSQADRNMYLAAAIELRRVAADSAYRRAYDAVYARLRAQGQDPTTAATVAGAKANDWADQVFEDIAKTTFEIAEDFGERAAVAADQIMALVALRALPDSDAADAPGGDA